VKLAKCFICEKLCKRYSSCRRAMMNWWTRYANGKHVHEVWLWQFHECVVDDCLANHQEWDEHSEERICIGHEESCHSRYVTHALHCMACNGIDLPPVVWLLLTCWNTVLVTNKSESMRSDNRPCFSLDEARCDCNNQWLKVQRRFWDILLHYQQPDQTCGYKGLQQTCCDWSHQAGWVDISGPRSAWVAAFGELLGAVGATCKCNEWWTANSSWQWSSQD
jgi:hypothetical protein